MEKETNDRFLKIEKETLETLDAMKPMIDFADRIMKPTIGIPCFFGASK
jgi:phage antirepressor YoqD-like protein